MLSLLAQVAGARRILEVGTLGGYSTIWLARALPEDGALVTLEIESEHARVARENLERAGVSAKVDIRVGPARASLAAMTDPAPFRFVFLDAATQNHAPYVAQAIRPGRSRTVGVLAPFLPQRGGV